MIKDLELAMVQRLTEVLTLAGQPHPKVDVLAWPNKPREYKMLHPHGCVMVIYKGSKYSDDKSTGGQYVSSDAMFELGILSRTLREPNVPDAVGRGAYELLDTCRTSLMGWQPDQASSIVRLVRDEFDDYAEGTWGYSLKIAIPMLTVAPRACPAPDFGVVVKQVDYIPV